MHQTFYSHHRWFIRATATLSLGEYLEPQQLEKFLTIVSKFRSDAPKGEFQAGMVTEFLNDSSICE